VSVRYVAFLRGVSPLNAKMPQLRRAFEHAGFEDVRTLLSSGNVVFNARDASSALIERRAEAAMETVLGRSFPAIVRSSEFLNELIAARHFGRRRLPAEAKCVVSFLKRAGDVRIELPLEKHGARILKQVGTEIFTVYLPTPKGPVFMALLERTFGREITTRTLDTVRKCALA
jgi:uncharacterized protein (DUF1697 family)